VRWFADRFLPILAIFLRPVFPASRVQHISEMQSKFALRPHHVSNMVDIQSATAEIRRGKKKLECGPMLNVMSAQPNVGGALCESSVIPFLVPRRKVWLTLTAWSAVQ